ncbi:hypothetical protein M3B46_10975 [Sphingobacterium daejeonense]|uniref:hypothetical protein n=1 Tax=Sphingobacterium daejeonense TaxID=371142 RepID=UPI0021A3F26C|nr:hypothetical protein [Sphingobacterium daejeonense]MCT1531519.1 hypothetical protein [Sphingobacterium daejeonense]
MKKKIFFLIGILLILINAPILNNFILYHTDNNTFKYSNLNGTFTCIDRFGFKVPGLTDLAFDLFVKETNQDKKDSELFRLYKINPLCFWRWNYYLTKSLSYKYKDWDEIASSKEYQNRKIKGGRYQQF